MANNVHNPLLLGILYVSLREKYFPTYKGNSFNVNDFYDLSVLLKKENIDPRKYMDCVFGLMDYTKPLLPKSLADPVLVVKYRQMSGDKDVR